MRKKAFLITLIIVLMAASLMVACGSGDEPATADGQPQTIAAEQETDKAEATSEEAETEATDSAKEAKAAETTKATETVKATEAAKAKPSSDKKTEPTTSTKAPAKQPTKATEAAKVCYITVEGYCTDKQIQIKGGESVYDILKKSGANVSARNTGYGLYVEGINGRFEFDEGPTSGWVYTVNGSRPSTSCDKYEIKSGDKIVWTYVEEV